jgi:hypothetical protein
VANPMGKTSVKPNAESYIMNPVLAFGVMNNHSKKRALRLFVHDFRPSMLDQIWIFYV